MASNHARRHSFERHQNVSFPVRSIEHLAEKRAALKHFLTRPPLHTSRCVSLPADTKCPRSFGNRYQNVLSALMTATVLRATVRVDVSALECHSLLRFKLRYLQTAGEDTTVVTLGHPCVWASLPVDAHARRQSMLPTTACPWSAYSVVLDTAGHPHPCSHLARMQPSAPSSMHPLTW